MRLCSPTNNQLHLTHVAYQYQSKSFNLTPPFVSSTLQKTRHFDISNEPISKPVFAKNAPIKKLTTKISRQTEFTMSRRLSADNKQNSKKFDSETSKLQPVNLSETSRDTASAHQRAADPLQSFKCFFLLSLPDPLKCNDRLL